MTETKQKRTYNKKPKERELYQFEKLAEGIYGLNYKKYATKLKYTKEQVLQLLESNNEAKLREASHYFFNVSGEYRRLVSYFSNLLTFDYLIVPKIKNDKTFDQNRFISDHQSILDYTDQSYIRETSRAINLIVVMDGVFYGYERLMNNNITTQQLPPDYCRSKYKINGNYAVEFNLRFFDLYKDTEQKLNLFKMFPDEFLDLYNDYRAGVTKEWVQLNPEFARCHKLQDEPSPLLSTVFPELINLKEYKELDKTQNEMDLYKLIVQKLPVDKNTGLPLLKLEEGRALHSNTKKMISQEGIDVITTPLDVEGINLQEKGQTLRDNIERATNGVYTSTGTSRILFNGGADGGSIGLSNSVITDASLLYVLLDQNKIWYESKMKFLLNNNKNYTFEFLFPEITIFNREKMFELFKEAATLGYSKLLPMVALGIKQSSLVSLLKYENNFYDLDSLMKPLKSAHTTSNSEGAPTKEQGELTPKGETTRNNETNKK